MQIKIIAVGKIKEKYFAAAINEYLKRLQRYVRMEIVEVNDEPCPENLTGAEMEAVRRKEGKKILQQITSQGETILLEPSGLMWDSIQLASFLENKKNLGYNKLTFVIGGSTGVSEEVKKRISLQWSLSALTFPHQLVRVLLLEQIYRAYKISSNEPYHK